MYYTVGSNLKILKLACMKTFFRFPQTVDIQYCMTNVFPVPKIRELELNASFIVN